ncbi:MAG: glycerate kinase [Armatimonadota bacterium]
MKIVVAPDSFKGSLSARDVADAIAAGVARADKTIDIDLIPLADGGEGTVDTMVHATNGRFIKTSATDPLGEKIDSYFGILGDSCTAVVEMATASGLTLVPDDKRNPMYTTSYGTGELIRAALDSGCKRLILAIGGSATNDGGVGAVQALGARFLKADGSEAGYGGSDLQLITDIDLSNLDARLKIVEVITACDVDNPLTGEYGASAIFGPQKGADPDMIKELDAGLHHLAEIIKRDVGVEIEQMPGAGAAGGMGAASVAFLGTKLLPGIDIVLDAVRFKDRIEGASLVITGEGRVDGQTLRGKAVKGVLAMSESMLIPLLVLAGKVDDDGYELSKSGNVSIFSIAPGPITFDESQCNAAHLLTNTAEQAVKLFLSGFTYNKMMDSYYQS